MHQNRPDWQIGEKMSHKRPEEVFHKFYINENIFVLLSMDLESLLAAFENLNQIYWNALRQKSINVSYFV